MKKLFFLLFTLLFSYALPAETLYYYAEGKKVLLTEDFSSYSFIRTTLTKSNFVMPQGVKVLKKHNNISIVEINDASAKENLTRNGALFPAYIKEGVKVHVSGQLFVRIPGRPNAEKAKKWCKKNGFNFIKQYKFVPEWYLVSVEGNPVKKAAELVESKIAEAAEPGFFIPLQKRAYKPNDPLFPNQWHLNNDSSNTSVSGNDHAHVAEAWEVMQAFKGNLGGKGIKLAIVDDGFDLDHEDFVGRFTNGYDFGSDDDDPSYENNDWNPDYSDMHGTCCAGVAGAATDNGTGVSGACPNCTLIPIRMDMTGYSLDSAAIESFEWAADNGADIISNSWGPEDNGGAADMNTTLKNLVANLTSTGRNGKGIVILFAAGNGNESIDSSRTKDGFAGNENVFAIGATNASGNRAYYSDFGPSLDFMAPSCDYSSNGYDIIDGIWTIDNTGRDGYNTGQSSQGDRNGNYTNDFGGTSSACPLAAGITGLVLSANPNLTRDEVYQIYVETSDKVGGVTYSKGFNENYGYGRINACEAVKKALEMAGKDVSNVTCGGSVVNPDPIDPDPDTTDTTDTTDTADTTDTSDTADTSDTTDTGDTSAAPVCGDGVIDANEICDGNTIPCANLTDAPKNGTAVCASDCMSWDKSGCYDNNDPDTDDKENCGNGTIDEGEQCDDGNRMDGDGCSKYCMKEDTKSKSSGCSLDLF